MYGMNVHNAVIESFEEETGITIHWVNENYDEGNIIKQYKCNVSALDTPETLSDKIKELELNYPPVIKSIL